MKVSYLALAATLAAIATGALAETGVRIDQTDNAANVYGCADVPKASVYGQCRNYQCLKNGNPAGIPHVWRARVNVAEVCRY